MRPPTATAAQFTSVTTIIAAAAMNGTTKSVMCHPPTSAKSMECCCSLPAAGDVEEDGEPEREPRQAAGGGHEEARPAVEESPQPAVRLADEYVLAAGLRHQHGELGVGQRAREAQQPADDPHGDDHPGRADVAGHDARLEEDARADDVGDDDGGRGEEAEAADQGDVRHRRAGAGSMTSTRPTSMNWPPRIWCAWTAMVFFPGRRAARAAPVSGTYAKPELAPGSSATSVPFR